MTLSEKWSEFIFNLLILKLQRLIFVTKSKYRNQFSNFPLIYVTIALYGRGVPISAIKKRNQNVNVFGSTILLRRMTLQPKVGLLWWRKSMLSHVLSNSKVKWSWIAFKRVVGLLWFSHLNVYFSTRYLEYKGLGPCLVNY